MNLIKAGGTAMTIQFQQLCLSKQNHELKYQIFAINGICLLDFSNKEKGILYLYSQLFSYIAYDYFNATAFIKQVFFAINE